MVDKMGPYELDQIYCGECSEMMSRLPDNSIDMWLTSPPYDNLRSYNGFVFPFEAIAAQLYRVTKPGGVGVWVVGDATINGSETGTSFRQALYFTGLGFNLHDTMIYEPLGTGAKGSNLAYWQAFEYMFVFSKGQPIVVNRIKDKKNTSAGAVCTTGRLGKDGGKKDTNVRRVSEVGIRSNIWQYNVNKYSGDDTDHPAPFPEALARDHILSWSNSGDLILDPMVGSGTTCKMAKELGRHFLGFDISEEYCDLARRRVEGARVPLFVESGPVKEVEPVQLGLMDG